MRGEKRLAWLVVRFLFCGAHFIKSRNEVLDGKRQKGKGKMKKAKCKMQIEETGRRPLPFGGRNGTLQLAHCTLHFALFIFHFSFCILHSRDLAAVAGLTRAVKRVTASLRFVRSNFPAAAGQLAGRLDERKYEFYRSRFVNPTSRWLRAFLARRAKSHSKVIVPNFWYSWKLRVTGVQVQAAGRPVSWSMR